MEATISDVVVTRNGAPAAEPIPVSPRRFGANHKGAAH